MLGGPRDALGGGKKLSYVLGELRLFLGEQLVEEGDVWCLGRVLVVHTRQVFPMKVITGPIKTRET